MVNTLQARRTSYTTYSRHSGSSRETQRLEEDRFDILNEKVYISTQVAFTFTVCRLYHFIINKIGTFISSSFLLTTTSLRRIRISSGEMALQGQFFFSYKPSVAAVVIAALVFSAITAIHVYRFVENYKTKRIRILLVLSMASFSKH